MLIILMLKQKPNRNGFEIVAQYDMEGREFLPDESLNILTVAKKNG